MRLGHEKARRRELARKRDPVFKPRIVRREKSGRVIRRLLHITGPNFECGAMWQRKRGQWTCISASELIPWMVGLNPQEAKKAMMQRPDWKYDWSAPLKVNGSRG